MIVKQIRWISGLLSNRIRIGRIVLEKNSVKKGHLNVFTAAGWLASRSLKRVYGRWLVGLGLCREHVIMNLVNARTELVNAFRGLVNAIEAPWLPRL